jgi:hypothetical protein
LGIHARSGRAISEHRHRRKLREREVSDCSRRGLDWTNFFLADVQMSFGSFLAFYLAGPRLVETERRARPYRWRIGGGGGANPRRRARRCGALEAGLGGVWGRKPLLLAGFAIEAARSI